MPAEGDAPPTPRATSVNPDSSRPLRTVTALVLSVLVTAVALAIVVRWGAVTAVAPALVTVLGLSLVVAVRGASPSVAAGESGSSADAPAEPVDAEHRGRHGVAALLESRLAPETEADGSAPARSAVQAGRRHSVGLLVISLDRLRAVTAVGDHRSAARLTHVVEQRLSSACGRRGDVVAIDDGRWAVVVDAAPTARDLWLLVERLRAAVLGADATLLARVTLSVGVCAVAPHERDGWIVLRDAEIACDRATYDGGNQVVEFHPSLREELVAEARFDNELCDAIAEGALEVHLQPAVDLQRGAVDHLEALVRWNHPGRGSVLPSPILAGAERNGLLGELDALVLDRTCGHAAVVAAEAGQEVTVTVNVHPRSLRPGASLESSIVETLERHDLLPTRLAVEVNVEALAAGGESALATLHRLAVRGVGIVLDGVVVGDDVVSHLDVLPPVRAVKVDGAVLAGLSPEGAVAVGTPLVAEVLRRGIDLVVMNVETERQLAVLTDAALAAADARGRLLAQGFAIQRPAAVRLLLPMLRDGWAPVSSGATV